jgi:hypothetical protein
MEKDSKHKLGALAVDGGMSNSDLTMQTQADILGIKVDRPVMRETTALGAAIAAGFAVDLWTEFDELKEINRDDRTIFNPQISEGRRVKMFKKWEQAVEMCRGWVLEDESKEEEVEEEKKDVDAEKKQVEETQNDTEELKEEVKEEKAAVDEEKKEVDAKKEKVEEVIDSPPSQAANQAEVLKADESSSSQAQPVKVQEEAAESAKALLEKAEEELMPSKEEITTVHTRVEPQTSTEDLPTPVEKSNPIEQHVESLNDATIQSEETRPSETLPADKGDTKANDQVSKPSQETVDTTKSKPAESTPTTKEGEVKSFSEVAKLDSDPTKSETSAVTELPAPAVAEAPVIKQDEFPPLGQEELVVKSTTVQV